MKRIFHPLAVLLLAVTLSATVATIAAAQGHIYVLESTAGTVRVGTGYAPGDRISVPAGASIRVVLPSGKTQTIKGPYTGSADDLAKGQKPNQSVMAWIRTLLQTGGSNERTPGATRSMRVPEPPPSFSWTTVPATVDGTVCVEKGARLQVRRAPSQHAGRITVIDQTSGQRGDVEFAPGKEFGAWPAALVPRPDRTYSLLAADNPPQRRVTLQVVDRLPGEDDILAELAARNCKYQFDSWVKEKIIAGRRKRS